jgi:hypothetical protein
MTGLSHPFMSSACIEDPPLIRKILGHILRREALSGIAARGPPPESFTDTRSNLATGALFYLSAPTILTRCRKLQALYRSGFP